MVFVAKTSLHLVSLLILSKMFFFFTYFLEALHFFMTLLVFYVLEVNFEAAWCCSGHTRWNLTVRLSVSSYCLRHAHKDY